MIIYRECSPPFGRGSLESHAFNHTQDTPPALLFAIKPINMAVFYQKPTTKRKRKRAAAVKRYAKKLQKEHEALERERTRY